MNKSLLTMMVAAFSLLSVKAELNPFVPFVAVTGRPTAADIARKIAALQADGYDQFLVYARSGLQFAYMGEEWLTAVETFCEEGAKRGMKVWLYDEYNWPSGTCKGRVPNEDPRFRYRAWAVYREQGGGFRWEDVMAPAGWVNVLDHDAVERFLDLTHRVYERRLAKYFANGVIKGIFTDEPGHPTAIAFDGKQLTSFAKWDGLEREYREATGGRDFHRDIEAYLDGSGDVKVWEKYAEIKGRRFRSAYFDRIRRWCEKMGIVSTGHMICEGDVKGSARYNGNPLLALRGESLPGIDEICSRVGLNDEKMEWVTLGVVQHAATRNRNGGSVELYACGPNDMSVARLRQLVWLTAFFNVDHYFASMQVMDHKGLVEKHGYFSPIQEGQPWHGELKASGFFDDARRAAQFARRLDFIRAAAIRYPQRAAARAAYTERKCPDLHGLIREFSSRQLAFDLIEETEESALPYIFECRVEQAKDKVLKTIVEVKTGEVFASAAQAAEWLAANAKQRVRYLEMDGKLAQGLLVRQFPDGSSVALDILNGGTRELIVEEDGVRSGCRIEARGVIARGAIKGFAYRLDRDNLFRLSFDKAQNCRVARFRLTTPLKNVRLVLRDFAMSYAVTASGRPVDEFEAAPKGEAVIRHQAENYSFELDGRAIAGVREAATLPIEYRSLYRETDALELATGEHEVCLVTGEGDRNYYLPAAWLAGAFAVQAGKIVPLPEVLKFGSLKKQGLDSFCGQLTYLVDAPVGAKTLRISTGGLIAKVQLDGVDLGTRAWSPFEWALPHDGKLAITLFTSVVNLMGELERDNADWDMKFWVKPRDQFQNGGLHTLEFVR